MGFPIDRPELCRALAFFLILGIQTGFRLMLRLGSFPAFSITCALPLLPKQVWDLFLAEDWHLHGRCVEYKEEIQSWFERCSRRTFNFLRTLVCSLALVWIIVTT